jgi:hypothetical protein
MNHPPTVGRPALTQTHRSQGTKSEGLSARSEDWFPMRTWPPGSSVEVSDLPVKETSDV